jgi:hypothetical protein
MAYFSPVVQNISDMNVKLLAALLLCGTAGMAQLNEDIPDTRKRNESFAKLPKDGLRNELAFFTIAGIEESVGKLPLDKQPYTALGADYMRFENGQVKMAVTTAPFEPGKLKLDYDEKFLIKINKKTYYGGYPNLPKTKIAQISCILGKDTVAIPPAAYADLYNLQFTYKDKGKDRSLNAVYFSKDKRTIYLYLYSRDTSYANASYEVTFVIQDKKYLRRVLDFDIQ